jgi:hypothetical protein
MMILLLFFLAPDGVNLYRTSPCTPICNTFIKRWNWPVLEQLLEDGIIFGERDLLKEYVE